LHPHAEARRVLVAANAVIDPLSPPAYQAVVESILAK